MAVYGAVTVTRHVLGHEEAIEGKVVSDVLE